LITAIILAAGEGSRMGKLKQLLPWGDKTIMDTVIDTVRKAKYVDQIVVVVGAEKERMKKHLIEKNYAAVKIVENINYQQGMMSSVQTGLKVLPESCQYIMFVLADKPLLTTEIVEEIIEEFLAKKPPIILPIYQGKKGHPVIIKKELIEKIMELEGEGGLRHLFEIYPEKIHYFPLSDQKITIDIDNPKQYDRYKPEIDGE